MCFNPFPFLSSVAPFALLLVQESLPVPPVIGRWLREGNDGLGTRLFADAPTEVEETIYIKGLPARVKFNLGATPGRIEAPRSLLGEMEPGFVSDLVHTTFVLTPTLRAVLINFYTADLTGLLAGILPNKTKSKDKDKDKAPTGSAHGDVVYWVGEDADNAVVFASKQHSPSETTRCAFGSASIGYKERVLPSAKMATFPVHRLPTASGLAFDDQVEGITTPSHMSGKVVALPRQCPLPWVRSGDPPTVGVLRSEFAINEDPKKLDAMEHLLWRHGVPLDMLDKLVLAFDSRP